MARKWEKNFKIVDGTSGYGSVNRLLSHLSRKSNSAASRDLYCRTLDNFCLFVSIKERTEILSPDDIVNLGKDDIGTLVQDFCDLKMDSRRYAVTQMHTLKTFFKVNGFKGDRELDLETYSMTGFGRKRPEYIPTLAEALKMADVAGCVRNRAIILTLLSTGVRVSTLCAILYGGIKDDLERGLENLQINVCEDMKRTVANAAKGRRSYTTFTSPEATEAIRLYLRERIHKRGKIADLEPLFIPELGRLQRAKRAIRPLTSREVQLLVKEAARKAGIEMWQYVTPHTIRKSFSSWVLCNPLKDGTMLSVKTQEILMGHTLPGSQDAYYDRTNIEELRKQHTKLNFTPRIEGRIEPFEILRIMSDALHIDFLQLLDSNKTKLQRDLTSEEQLRLIKEALQKKLQSPKEPCSIETAKPQILPKQTFLSSQVYQEAEPGSPKVRVPENKPPIYKKSKTTGQLDILSFSCSSPKNGELGT
jgi:integrase